MPSSVRWAIFLLVVLAIGSQACDRTPRAAAVTPLVIGTGSGLAGGVYRRFGTKLAEVYNARLPHVRASAPPWGPADLNPTAIEEGRADLALIGADSLFPAFVRGTPGRPQPHQRLRGIAVLYPSLIQIVVRADSGIRQVSDLRGRAVGLVGPAGTASNAPMPIVLEVHGLSDGVVRVRYLSAEEIAGGLRDRTLAGGLFYAAVPLLPLQDLSRTTAVTVLPIEQRRIAMVQARSPSLVTMTVPAGAYEGQPADVTTVGIDNVLVCRADLSEPLVHDLTKALFEAVVDLAAAHVAAGVIDPERGPATPIPLHPGAARYYRERELGR